MGAITRTPEKFDAAVPMRGIYAPAKIFDLLDRVGKIFVMTGQGGLPEEQPAAYDVADVVSLIDRIQAPVLIMHGEEDARAPFLNFQLAVEALERHGKEFESKSYPGEGHGFRNPENQVDLYRRLEEFFDRHLR
jgi:dipeptidyl aminopeptidase/acylaminoacyl peptidase